MSSASSAESQSGASSTAVSSSQTAAGGERAAGGAAEGGDAEIRALVTEALTPQLCPRLMGSFIGLPGEGTARGPAAGTLPTAGRWWIRRCTARVNNGHLDLALGGMGWTWVDQETSGFRVRQYMLFETDVELSADVTVGYDRTARIASLWMTPAAGVTARVTPRGVVTAEPTGFFATIVGGILPITGASASDRAREQVEQIGSRQMRERLGAGFTMTLRLDTHQVDFMVGALQRGEVPERPYPNDTAGPWQVNQRSMVWPGGLDVVGPLDLAAGPQGLDVQLEEGEGATIRAACAEPVGRYFDQRFQSGGAGTAPPPTGTLLVELTQGAPARHVAVPQASCPTLLLVAPRAGSTLPVRLRYRVAPEPPPGSTVTAAAGQAAASVAAPARLSRVRIQIIGVTVNRLTAAGHDWDVVGGDADPYVLTASIPLRRQIDRTPTASDSLNATWSRWLPGAYDATQDFPLRFTVYDADNTSDELIGEADLDANALPTATGDLALPIRTTSAVPVQTGTLRLRIEATQ